MHKEPLIKDKNRKWLIFYLLFHVVLFALFISLVGLSFRDINELVSKLKSSSGFFPLLSFPAAIVFEAIIHSDYKAVLVFWRLKNPLPGCRAFSHIATKDPRIDEDKLRNLFPEGLPRTPKEQNSKWYKLYRTVSEKPIVHDAHKSFLLTRDLAALTAILIPCCLIVHLFWKTEPTMIFYHLLLLVFITIVVSLSSQNYGKRFVANVLVEATSHFKED